MNRNSVVFVDEEQMSSYSDLQEVFYSFVDNLKANSATKGRDSYVITSVKPLNVETKSEAIGDLFEMKFKNEQSGEEGFSLVGRMDSYSNVFAFVPNGELRDTVFNEGLKEYCDYLKSVFGSPIVETKDWGADMVGNCFYDPDYSQSVLVRELTSSEAYSIGSKSPCVYDETVDFEYREVSVPVKWGQGHPYNLKVQETFQNDGKNYRCGLGCGVIAMGQVMAFHKKPEGIRWDLLLESESIGSDETERVEEVSTFLYDVAKKLNHSWGRSGIARVKNICNVFSQYGYSSEYKYYSYKDTLTYGNHLIDYWGLFKDCSSPIIVGAQNGNKGGHAFVVDAVMQQSRLYCDVVTITTTDGNSIYMLRVYPVYGYLTRCNWGWNGSDDGWYWEFKPNTRPNLYYNAYKEIVYNIKPGN